LFHRLLKNNDCPPELSRNYDSSDDESLEDDSLSNLPYQEWLQSFHSSSKSPDVTPAPIRPVHRQKGKRRPNVFTDDRGFPDVSDEFDTLLHNIEGGAVLRRRKHPSRDLSDIDPKFNVPYIEELHGKQFREEFKPSPLLSAEENAELAALIKEYWCVFDTTGLFIPVRDYECVIDTGSAAPIAVKNINYGPREAPIMREQISKLEKLGHISQIHDGRWLFKALLAPKPHQEHICDILKFKWRFCVNYIPLNSITLVIVYPIPCCDAAVNIDFGQARWFYTMDAPQGYHQIRVAKESREKLAFAGPDAIKWTYNVMPFGPVNGPTTFIVFMHDMDSRWKEVAASRGVKIDEDTNTRIIVDDLFNHGTSFRTCMTYLRAQLDVARCQNLSISLAKCVWFPPRVEFVGIDVGIDGNRPAQSKHQLLESWPAPTTVRDVASFVGFALFYAQFIPLFEVRIKRLHEIMLLEYTASVTPVWDTAAQEAWDDIRAALLIDPCLQRFDHWLRLYLLTDFCKDGFGWCACQPGSDDASRAAMFEEMAGGECKFLLPNSKLTLHPIALGCRRTRGLEPRLHSYLGEGFAGNYAINKVAHYCWGMQFTWITDCYALRYVLSYDGNNPAVLRLQMRLMCWDMVIVHRPGTTMAAPDYLSRLGADLCFDPLLRDYIAKIQHLKKSNPTVSSLPMLPENMPGYKGPRRKKQDPADESPTTSLPCSTLDTAAQALISSILVNDSNGHALNLSNIPIRFGMYEQSIHLTEVYKATPLYNHDLVLAARTILEFQWAVYSFNCGHFINSIQADSLPFRFVLVADAFIEGRSLFKEFSGCTIILDGARELYNHIRTSGDNSVLDSYLIHSHHLPSSESNQAFWQLQASIIVEMRKIRGLSLFVAVVHRDHDNRSVSLFCSSLKRRNWILSDADVYFPSYGDSVADNARIIIGVHATTETSVTPVTIPSPPSSNPPPIASYLWHPFNSREYAVSFARNSPKFGSPLDESDSSNILVATDAKINPDFSKSPSPEPLYCLHP
jgi:hypothetical protein